MALAAQMPAPGIARQLVKRHAGIVRGSSSAAIERHVTTAALSLWQSLGAADQERIKAGETDWLEAEAVLRHYTAPQVSGPGRKATAGEALRHWSSIAVEKLLILHRSRLYAEIHVKKQRTVAKMRERGLMQFSVKPEEERKSWLPPGYMIQKRVRKRPAAAAVEIIEEPAPSTPGAAAAEIVEEPPSTEKLIKGRWGQRMASANLGEARCKVVSDLSAGKSKQAPEARIIFVQCLKGVDAEYQANLTSRVKNSKNWKAIDCKYRGRPKGQTQWTDARLEQILEEHTAPSSRWCRRRDKIMRHLPMSKRRLAAKLWSGGIKLSRRQLSRRLQNGKLAVSVGHRRSDDCQVQTRS